MISIIISTYQPQYLQQVQESIATTIGVPYEVIAIENKGQMGICTAYNKGVANARYPVVCFIHEDIVFRTANWGKILSQYFDSDPQLGLVGVAGSNYKPLSPSHWSYPEAPRKTFFMNIIQGFKDGSPPNHIYLNPGKERFYKVAAIDGVFMAGRRQVFAEVPFDEKTFTHFHGYDADISIAIGQHYNVAVTFDILIEHLSEGNFERKWIEEMIKLHEKWKNILPIQKTALTRPEQVEIETGAMLSFQMKMKRFHFKRSEMLKMFTFRNAHFSLPFFKRAYITAKLLLS